MKNGDRLQALQVLMQVFDKQVSLSQALPANSSSLTKALCYGVCRHYYRLEVLAKSLLSKNPKDREVWLIILLGLYQLYWLNLPDYAVVKETVNILVRLRKIWAKGLVNAVLRTAQREQETIKLQLADNIAFVHGHPAWLLELLQLHWPQQWQQIAEANDKHPPMTIRVNQRHNTTEAYEKLLTAAQIDYVKLEATPTGLTLTEPMDVYQLPDFAKGTVSVQDGAAQQAAFLMDLKPGLRVLDACAAPGGKTCHMLELEPQLALCQAVDIDEKRLQKVRDNLHRLGLQASCIQGDLLQPDTWWDGISFDRILLDAPCSATGVIRRHPDIKILRTHEAVKAITNIQASLLEILWPLLKPGGLLVYATCSLLPVENADQIKIFAEKNTDCQIKMIDKPWGLWTGYGRQILPGDHNMDGFFYSVLEKCTQSSNIYP